MQHESRVLDAPNIRNDYYLNVMDWGRTNILAVALDKILYLWNADSRKISLLSEANSDDDYPASVAWSEDAKTIAAGYRSSVIELYDAETLKRVRIIYMFFGFRSMCILFWIEVPYIFTQVRCLKGHRRRVGSIAWNSHVLTSGSCDRSIIHHDGIQV